VSNCTDRIKNISTLVKIYEGEEQSVGIHLTVSPRVCYHQKFLMRLPTRSTALTVYKRSCTMQC